LVIVAINPESRVKAARGPAAAELREGRETVALVKVVNEAGVTHALRVTGPQLIASGRASGERWLHAVLRPADPDKKTLTGHRTEFLLLHLKTQGTGKREAILRFDVGQGTQDLGFRAELPILFTVRPPTASSP
jgi:hypothetical protein